MAKRNEYNIPLSVKLNQPLETKLLAIMKKYDCDRSQAIRHLINKEVRHMTKEEKQDLGLE